MRLPREGSALAAIPGRAATHALLELARDEALAPDARTALARPAIGSVPALLEVLELATPDAAARITSVLARMQRIDFRRVNLTDASDVAALGTFRRDRVPQPADLLRGTHYTTRGRDARRGAP